MKGTNKNRPLLLEGVDRIIKCEQQVEKFPDALLIMFDKKDTPAMLIRTYVDLHALPSNLQNVIRSFFKGERVEDLTKEEELEILHKVLPEAQKRNIAFSALAKMAKEEEEEPN